jgi:hypothetical protein
MYWKNLHTHVAIEDNVYNIEAIFAADEPYHQNNDVINLLYMLSFNKYGIH